MTSLKTPYQARVYRVPPKDFAPQVEVAACYISHNGQYLFLHRAEGKPQENTWGVPAGKLDKGESPRTAVLREVKEETGICLDEAALQEFGPLYVRYPHLDFIYHTFAWKAVEFPQVSLSDEHQGYRWVGLEELGKLPLISGAQEALQQFLALEGQPILPRKSFFFVRHGETDANVDPRLKRVDDDLPLNEKGRQQAIVAKEIVRELPLKKVTCSPIQRAQQTKDLMFAGVDLAFHDDDRLKECCARIWTKMVKLEEGSDYEVCDSVKGFLSRVIHGVAAALQEDEPGLIVAHGGTHWALCHYLSIEDHPWRIGNCKVVHFEPTGHRGWKARILSQ